MLLQFVNNVQKKKCQCSAARNINHWLFSKATAKTAEKHENKLHMKQQIATVCHLFTTMTIQAVQSFYRGQQFSPNGQSSSHRLDLHSTACAHRVAQVLLELSGNQGKSSKFELVRVEPASVALPCGTFTLSA